MWIKWLGEQNIKILGPWPGNSPGFNPIENLWSILKRVDKQNPTNSDKLQALILQEWAAINQNVAQMLTEACQDESQRKRQVNTANSDSLHKLNVIVNKSLCHLSNAFNYTSVYHRKISQKYLKTLKQQTLLKKKQQLVSFSKPLATAVLLLQSSCFMWST